MLGEQRLARFNSSALVIAMLAVFAVLPGCKSHALTRAGDSGHWSITRYVVRVYDVDIAAANGAGEKYFAQAGYKITDRNTKAGSMLLHGFTEGRKNSLIIRCRPRGEGKTAVEMKAGPGYDRAATVSMMDEFQKLLPAQSQPK